MKTTQKSLLLLGLCTLFGFLVYVDFMGGVRGDEEDKVKKASLQHSKETIAQTYKNNKVVYDNLISQVRSRGVRDFDKRQILKYDSLFDEFEKAKKIFQHKSIKHEDIPQLLNELVEKVMEKDTVFSGYFERINEVSLEEISEDFWKKSTLGEEESWAKGEQFLARLETSVVEMLEAKLVGNGGCGFSEIGGADFQFYYSYFPLPPAHLLRYKNRVHQGHLLPEYFTYERYNNTKKIKRKQGFSQVKAKLSVRGNHAKVVMAYTPLPTPVKDNDYELGYAYPNTGMHAFYVSLPTSTERVTENSQVSVLGFLKVQEEKGIPVFKQEQHQEILEELINPSNKEEKSETWNLQRAKLGQIGGGAKSFQYMIDTLNGLTGGAFYKNTSHYKWFTDNVFRIEGHGKWRDILNDKLITYDLPLTPTPEGYVLDWPFPTDLYPLELKLEVFPASGQKLVISKDFKGKDLPQGGKRFFWKKFPSKNLHLELKGETTVVLQSEAQENEEPAFSLSARADLPQEKAAPQHTAFLLDASERTKAQRFGEYAALLLQLLEKEEKHIPNFSLFYFQKEAQAYGKALPNTPTERQKLRRFLQSLKPQGAGTLEKTLPKFAEFVPKGSRTLLLVAGNIHHGDVHEIADSLGNQGVKIHPKSPIAHAAPLLQKGLRCYTLEDGIAEQHHPLLNYIAHASGGQRLQFHGLKDAENVMQKLLSQPWEIEKIEVEGAKDLLFSKQIRALLPGQHFQLNGKGQWPGAAKIYLRSTDGRQKTLEFKAEPLSSPLPPREYARALLEVYAAKGNTPETRFHEATLRKKYNIAGRFFRFSNQLEEAYASPYTLLKDFDPNWQESTLQKDATLQNYTDAFPNYSPRRVLFAALNRYALAHEKAFSPEEKALFLNLPESAFEKQEIAQWIARFEKATPAEKEVAELKEILATLI